MRKFSIGPSQSRPGSKRSPKRRAGLRTSILDSVFSALSDPTRRAMLERLSQGAVSVTELAKPFKISLPAISKHLRVLEESGLIVRERQGRVHKLHLDPAPLMSTAAWIAHYRPLWEQHLDSLGAFLRESKHEGRSK